MNFTPKKITKRRIYVAPHQSRNGQPAVADIGPWKLPFFKHLLYALCNFLNGLSLSKKGFIFLWRLARWIVETVRFCLPIPEGQGYCSVAPPSLHPNIVAKMSKYSDVPNNHTPHLINIEKFSLSPHFFTFTNKVKSSNFTFVHLHKWKACPKSTIIRHIRVYLSVASTKIQAKGRLNKSPQENKPLFVGLLGFT